MNHEAVARALARIVELHGVSLHQAVHQFGQDLARDKWATRQARQRKEQRQTQRIEAAKAAAQRLPSFIRLGDHGLPMTWTQRDWISNAAPAWLRCHTIPDEEALNDPTVRRQIHGAAALAGITGPQRIARAMESGEYERMLEHHADFDTYRRELQGNGHILLIGLDNARASVPPEWSTAKARRWTYDEPAPTSEQLELYAWLSRDRQAAGLHTPPPPTTAREIAAAIAAIRPIQ